MPPAPPGELYTYQLIGCHVELPDGEVIGRVREIWDAPAHPLLVVDGPEQRDRLIPMPLAREIDVAAHRIVIEDRPGLIDPV